MMLAPASRAVFQYFRVVSAIAGKENKINPRKRFRFDLLDEAHFVARCGHLSGRIFHVQQHHVAGRKQRLRQRVAQLFACERRRSDNGDPIWSAR